MAKRRKGTAYFPKCLKIEKRCQEPSRGAWRGSGLSGPKSLWSVWLAERDRQDRPSHEIDSFGICSAWRFKFSIVYRVFQ